MTKKSVIIHPSATDEFVNLNTNVQEEFRSLIKVLEVNGRLVNPEAKKMSGYNNLFEMRIRLKGQWRGFYCYIGSKYIVILHFTNKKSQKTPLKTIKLVIKRKRDYE